MIVALIIEFFIQRVLEKSVHARRHIGMGENRPFFFAGLIHFVAVLGLTLTRWFSPLRLVIIMALWVPIAYLGYRWPLRTTPNPA